MQIVASAFALNVPATHVHGFSELGFQISLEHGLGRYCVGWQMGQGVQEVDPSPYIPSMHLHWVMSDTEPLEHLINVVAF